MKMPSARAVSVSPAWISPSVKILRRSTPTSRPVRSSGVCNGVGDS